MVILGGVDTVQNPFTYLAFSKTQAFSPRGRCRPFDAGADGIVISEGVAAVVLKRLADAERDGDRIYAVIKGVGASSDGRARGLTAPVVEGQIRAIERAYAKAGDLAGDGRLRRGARHRHGAGRRGRGRSAGPGLPGRRGRTARLRRRLGQVADRPHQVRRGAGRADQRLAGAPSQGAAADDRDRDAQPQARPARRPVPPLHAGRAVAPSRRRTARGGRRSAPSVSAGPTSTPSSRNTTATRARPRLGACPTGRRSSWSSRPTGRPA